MKKLEKYFDNKENKSTKKIKILDSGRNKATILNLQDIPLHNYHHVSAPALEYHPIQQQCLSSKNLRHPKIFFEPPKPAQKSKDHRIQVNLSSNSYR
jgi:hypothetical protein